MCKRKKKITKSKDSETGLVVASLADEQKNICVALKVGLMSGLVRRLVIQKLINLQWAYRLIESRARTYNLVKFVLLKKLVEGNYGNHKHNIT